VIDTLVVDDDYRVAHVHAASLERVEGFHCVGEAHTAAEAREAILRARPQLLLLDLYLPDEDGLELLRSLPDLTPDVPDCVVVTAARDVQTVRTAMRSGALYYLVKPFGFAQLRDQLLTYRRWREEVDTGADAEADQATVDRLFGLLRPQAAGPPRQLPPTMRRVLDAVRGADRPIGAQAVADLLGMSRPTAQRYLTELERRGALRLDLEYGAAGRPVHRYAPVRRSASPE
jgi:response regulator of citrate/malate metabolism